MPTRISTARLDAGWKRTDEGFIDARVFITRPGVFPYWDEDLKKVVYELRPTEEVHKQAHLDSYLGKPFTNNHPPKMVKSGAQRLTASEVSACKYLRQLGSACLRAQRLTASEVSASFQVALNAVITPRAQRLTASEVSALPL